jgi:signal transduction histidine kinase/DNA-binding response OmpR family regulator/HPt (histidine-containing phosphotransfer) domain-containing protein
VKNIHLKLFLPLAIGLLVLVPALLITWFSYTAAQQTAVDAANSVMVQASLRASEAANADLAESSRLMNYFSSYGDAVGGEPDPDNFTSVDRFEEVAWGALRGTRLVKFVSFASVDGSYRAINLYDEDALPEILLQEAGQTKRKHYRSVFPLDRRMLIGTDKVDYKASSRPWYRAAMKAADQTGAANDQRAWTDVYPSFSRNQLQIAHAVAVRNNQRELIGVLALDVSFKLLNELLHSLQISPNAIAFIIDNKGNLVASSIENELSGARDIPLLSALTSSSPMVRGAIENLPQSIKSSSRVIYKTEELTTRKKSANATCLDSGRCENFQFELNGQTILSHASLLNHLPEDERSSTYPILSKLARGENFPEWRLIIALPADDFNYVIKERSQRTLLLAALLALLASAFGIWFARRLNSIIGAIARAAVKLGHGDLAHSPIRTHFSEFRQISDELEHTADALRESRNALMAQNAELEERVLERTRDLAHQTEEAMQAVHAKAAFLATMSHEIRTPMNGVIGMTDLLAGTALNAEQRDYVNTIRSSGDALLTIINDILDFSKIDSGKMELEREPLSVLQLIEESLVLVAGVANRKNLELLYEIDPDVPALVMGDVTRLRQIILNLLSNAVKFTESGEIHVHVQQENPLQPEILSITVRDTGIGIPADRIGLLFSAFTQIDAATTRKYGGTGLGLAISRRLAELMHGSIEIQSELGRGSRFIVRIKAHPAVASNLESALLSGSLSASSSAQHVSLAVLQALQGKRALVMDDNATSLRILQHRLAHYGVLSSAVANLSALNELIAHDLEFDFALIDFDMPDMNGLSIAQHLQSKKALPVVLLSNVADSKTLDPEQCCQVHLFKPIKESLLLDALIAVLNLNGGTAQHRVESAQHIANINESAQHARIQSDAKLWAQQHPLRMLVADDNATNRKVAMMMLEKIGYRAEAVNDGREAVDIVVAADTALQPFDLIWMDVHMPNLDGLESTKILRQSAIQQAHIVAMTAAAMHGDREMCLQAGMNDYVSKPLEIADLQRALYDYFKLQGIEFEAAPQAALQADLQESSLTTIASNAIQREIKYFDPDRFMAFCEGNPSYRSTFLVLIRNMINKSSTQYVDAHQAWHDGQNEEAARTFHTMRGSLGTLGALEFVEISQQIENAMKQNESTQVEALFIEIKDVLDRTMSQAQQWLDQQEGN